MKVLGQLVYTNNTWGGAARGAGPLQMNFALESAVDLSNHLHWPEEVEDV